MTTRLIWSSNGSAPHETSAGQTSPLDMAFIPDLGRRTIRAGAKAPDFLLADQRGRRVALGALLRRGPVVLRFCRNENTADCVREFKSLSKLHSHVNRLGATLIVVAIEPFDPRPLGQDISSFPFPILPDPEGGAAEAYGLTYTHLPHTRDLSVIDDDGIKRSHKAKSAPATYVVDRDGMVAVAFVDLECRSLMDHRQILVALECLTGRKSR
jgi:peroxiredoxin